MFIYNTNEYYLTVYQANGVNNELNSDAVQNTFTIDGKDTVVGATDELTIKSDTVNIDIGLIEKEKSDFKLEKFVSKIIITNKQGTKTRTFNRNSSIPKVEIKSKYLSGSTAVIEYTFRVTNVGEKAGYINNIADKIPSSLEYKSNLNSDWYEKDGILYNESLVDDEIEPGEYKEVKLTLTKKMTESNTGLTKNTANILCQDDTDTDNDESSGEFIITVSTGETTSFVFITLITSTLISIGVCMVMKKYIILND